MREQRHNSKMLFCRTEDFSNVRIYPDAIVAHTAL